LGGAGGLELVRDRWGAVVGTLEHANDAEPGSRRDGDMVRPIVVVLRGQKSERIRSGRRTVER
jgi:hypothetical protein